MTIWMVFLATTIVVFNSRIVVVLTANYDIMQDILQLESMLCPSRCRSSQRRGTGRRHHHPFESSRTELVRRPRSATTACCRLAVGPGDGLEVLCLREICLEEPAAAGLLNGEERTTEVQQPPQLRGVLLSRAGYHAEVETRDLVRIKEACSWRPAVCDTGFPAPASEPSAACRCSGGSGSRHCNRAAGSRAHQGSAGRRPARV